jgi:type I restriction enzyme S subunit
MKFDGKVTTLEDLMMLDSGFAFKSSDWVETGTPVIKIRNVQDGYVDLSGCSFVSDETAKKASSWYGEIGNTLIALTGAGVGEIGRIRENQSGLINQRVGWVRPKDAEVEDYIYYLLRYLKNEIIELASGSAQPNVSPKDILRIECQVPPIAERKAVGIILANLDEKIQLNKLLTITLEEMAQTIFKSWFIDFDPVRAKMAGEKPTGMESETAALFPDSMEESEIGLIPKGWKVRSIGDSVIKQKVGKLFDSKTSFRNGTIPVLDQGKSGVVGFHDEEPGIFASPDKPLVVFANHTCSLRLVSYPFSVIQNVFPLMGNKVDVIWLYFAVEGKQQFDSYKGHWPDFVLHKIIQPTEEATQAFRCIIEPLLQEKWLLEQQSKSLGNLRDSLLPRLITGELQIPEEMLAS